MVPLFAMFILSLLKFTEIHRNKPKSSATKLICSNSLNIRSKIWRRSLRGYLWREGGGFSRKKWQRVTPGVGAATKRVVLLTQFFIFYFFVNFFCNRNFAPLYLMKLIKFEEQPFPENFTIFTGKYLYWNLF